MREKYEQWFRASYAQEPMPRTSQAYDFCWAGYKAGAASRDAEVAELKQTCIDHVEIQNALRDQVTLLRRDALKYSKHQCEGLRVCGGMSWSYHPFQVKRIFDACEKALATTEPK